MRIRYLVLLASGVVAFQACAFPSYEVDNEVGGASGTSNGSSGTGASTSGGGGGGGGEVSGTGGGGSGVTMGGNKGSAGGMLGTGGVEPDPEPTVGVCGDGTVDDGEVCDDGNVEPADGCSKDCALEAGWSCNDLSPSECTPGCGDGSALGTELDVGSCDDGNMVAGDGCGADCTIEPEWQCAGVPSTCSPRCGDGKRVGDETSAGGCDDGNLTAGDGCDAECRVEAGFDCGAQQPTVCTAKCGDGLALGAEAEAGGCDDKGTLAGDGCSATCRVESGWSCTGQPSACAEGCGDGLVLGREVCDDKNEKAGDGCAACQNETGWSCSGAPSACVDEDECKSNKDNCHASATCSNTAGSFTCRCNSGYSGNGVSCVDIIECSTGADDCHDNATCTNTVGSFTCKCKDGYTGDGRTSCQKTQGQKCDASSQCASGSCIEGVCCDTTCGGRCQSCLNANTGLTQGRCGAVKAGIDPLNQCDAAAASTCRQDGTCDGNGACRLHVSGTRCRDAQCVDSSTSQALRAAACNGSGACNDTGAPVACGSYTCGGTSCRTTCTVEDHCVNGYYCDTAAQTCRANRAIGAVCSGNNQCGSNICGGRCCSRACNCLQPTSANLLSTLDPGFDAGLGDWRTSGSVAHDISFDGTDCDHSGSVALTPRVDLSSNAVIHRCVEVNAGTRYHFGGEAAARQLPGDWGLYCSLGYFTTSADCNAEIWSSGEPVYQGTDLALNTPDQWVSFNMAGFVAPSGTRFARVECDVVSDTVESTTVLVDMFYLSANSAAY